MYARYNVYRRAPWQLLGGCEAESPQQAVFRLLGGAWGREDALALEPHACPMAGPGLTSYRYRGRYGFVMIGARDTADALSEAARSITGEPDPARLEIWNPQTCAYERATPGA